MRFKGLLWLAILGITISWIWGSEAYALKAPHKTTGSYTLSCADCHKHRSTPRRGFYSITSGGDYNLCYNDAIGCHVSNPGTKPDASKKRFAKEWASNRFGSLPADPNAKQFSHGWKIPNTKAEAGATNNWAPMREYGDSTYLNLKSKIYCTRCHRAHGDKGPNGETIYRSFLKGDPKGDYICLQCHEARNIDSVRSDKQSDVIAGTKHYSHPVQVSYSGAKYRKSQEKDSEGANLRWEDWFEASPTNEPGWSESARPRLYTSYDGTKKDAVVCSTCHGPMHSADSNPYTFDSLSTYSRFGQISTTAGNLLRRYPMSNATWGDKTCASCHKVKTHQGYQCNRCHEPHKRKGDNNIYLIRTSIQTPYAKQSVYFTSTSEMAQRYGIYSGTATDTSQRSKRICQVCHRTKSHHRAYSTVGADREHKYLGNNKYQNCVLCHPHNAAAGGFAQTGGCSTCHDAPPSDNGNTWGKHAKHVGAAGYKWMPTPPTVENTLNDTRSASDYGFSCGRCHNAWTPYTASATGKNHYGSAPGSLKNFTADIGFGKGTHPLPTNSTNAGYNYGATGGIDNGMNSGDVYTWRYPGTGGTDGQCRNLYCHGQFYNGYTSNNPTWRGTQTCGACHGAKRSDPPGKTAGTNWGAHPRHVGNAGNQQYGFSGWKFGCNACHYPTTMSSITSIDDRSTHVDGRATVEFNGGGYGDANSRYDGFVDYTSRKPQFFTKPAYKTCGLIYCHSDGSRTQGNYSAPFNAGIGSGSGKYPNWSSTRNFTTTLNVGGKTFKRRCSRCHGNSTYVGITAAMPGVTSKGNSHTKHVINNGFLCDVCHSTTVNADNKSIASTTLHVNKAYDISIISKYGGTYDSGTKRCSNVDCHGGRLTGAWGDAGRCQDCHFKSTSESQSDEGYNDSYTWRNMTTTSSIPRIYSSEWTKFGHGATASYPSSGNSGANKSCYYGGGGTGCHKASGNKSHKDELTGNVYRLYTGYNSGNTDFVCKECHSGGARSGEATKNNIKGHTYADMGGWGNATWQFTPKCIDCHDPHGDKNRYMMHKHDNYSGSDPSGKRTYDTAQTSGLINFSTVGGGQMNWSSYVKADYSGLCQRCHNLQTDMNNFNKAAKSGGGYSGHQSGNRCINCHKHTEGFKGLNCNGCHYFPPTLSGKHAFHVATSVDNSHVSHDLKSTKTKYAYGCGKCHDVPGSHYTDYGTLKVYTADLAFDANDSLPRNTSAQAQYAFGAKSSFDDGVSGADNFKWVSTKGTCKNLYCHGQFFGGYSGNDPNWYNNGADDPQTCGKCHGAVKNSSGSPTGGAHNKHVTTYSFPCRNCHRDTTGGFNAYTVADRAKHVNGITNIFLYTTESRIGGNARYGNAGSEFISVTTNTNPASAPNYRFCQNIYCHSRGTALSSPFALSNYTAKWGSENLPANPGEKCSYCHGSKKTAGGYAGITSAMPNYNSGSPKINSHKKHVVDNGFSCYACHANTVDSTGRAISASGVSTYHVNKAYDVSFPSKYNAGSALYNGDKTCSSIKCHGGRLTPAWGGTAINCTDCHYRSTAGSDQDVMDYTFRNYTDMNSVPKIYSTEWKASGHGKSAGSYNRTNNPPAGKICNTCHVSSVKHNTGSNFFRLTGLGGGTDPSSLCRRCHGTGSSQLQSGWFGNKTGIQGHTQQILSAAGYSNLTTWRFTPKCIDCHDPHGDAQASTGNIAMIRNTYIYNDGSDSSGRPNTFPNISTATFAKYTATNSFDNNDGTKGRVCAVCHKRTAHNGNGTGHTNAGLDCRSCHKHKQGFNPSGCTGCHGDDTRPFERSKYAPPKGPSTFGWTSDDPGNSGTWGIHQPHAYNPKKRPGFNNQTGFACSVCHGNNDGRSEAGHPGSTNNAGMNNLTSSATTPSKRSKWAPGSDGKTSVIDDTCWNTGCHTPRSYTRTWKKPVDCDDCHGFQQKTATVYATHTTQSHKIHVRYTSSVGYKKKYGFACSNCHYNWVTNNNYSTHYNSFVNITANGPVNTVGADFYTRGRSFKGFTTGNESLGTCSKTYCHGNFVNGTSTVTPNWKKGVSSINCGSCHKAKTAKVATWQNGTTMPERHPKHVRTSTYNFACSVCHNWTVTNNTTVQFTYSSHVNSRKDVNFGSAGFGSVSGRFNSSTRQCQTSYCHSRGSVQSAPYAVANYTADWDENVNTKTGNKPCAYCHGDRTQSFGGITAAMPNQAGQAHAKHARNTQGDSFRCNVCHANVVSAAGVIISNTNHVNKFKNISIIGTYKSGQTAYSTTVALKKTCKNIKCHGGRTTPLWTLSTGINCMDCHKSTTGDTDKRISVNNPFQGYSETAAKIYSTAWAQRGHGRPTTSGNYPVSGNAAANKTCTACHGSGETRAGWSTKHGTANNPFRLITAPNRPNVLCESCHGTNATNPGKGAMVGIQSHASSVTGGGGNGYSYWMKCIDCHDPHGDNNVQMIHSTIARPSALLTKKESSNTSGQLFYNATGRNVDFVNNVYTSDYAKKTTAPRVCQVCHTQTEDVPDTNKTRFQWNGTADTAHGTSKCTSCHGHNQGFKGVKCDACHGNPPTGTFNVLSGPGRTNQIKKRFSGTTSAGAHQRHIQIFGSDPNTCAMCHQGGMYNSGAENDDIDLGFKAFNLYTGRYTGRTGVRSGFYGYSGTGIMTGNTARCNVMCHGGGVTGGWLTASYGTPTAPMWERSKRTATCGKCHGAKKAAGQGSWPTTGKHILHAGTGGTQLNYMCQLCHNSTVLGTATTLDTGFHVNAVANVAFGTAADQRADNNSTYTDSNSQVNSAVNGKCTNTYCHSKGTDSDLTAPYTNTADFAIWTATWDDARGGYNAAQPSKAKCNYCHGNKSYRGITSAMPIYASGSPKANSHSKHVISNGIVCSVCHYGVARNNTSISDATRHANRFYNISIAPGYRAAVGKTYSMVYNGSGGTCKNITCHGASGTPKWGSTVGCRSCHFSNVADTNNYANWSGFKGTAAQIYSTDWGRKGHGNKVANCDNCHDVSDASPVAHGASNNPFRLFTSDTDRGCLNCHGVSTDRNNWSGYVVQQYTGIKTHSKNALNGGGSWNFGNPANAAKCVDCHDPHGDNNRKMIHALINYTGSDRFGRPSVPPSWNTLNPSATAQMRFTAWGGQMNWSTYVGNDLSRSLCRRCHTTGDGGFSVQMTKGVYTPGHQSDHTKECTSCHSHKEGFKGGGESSGNTSCKDCHSDLFDPMNSQAKSYHHVMQNTTATGANKYPTGNVIGDPDARRRCLMCHADHNVFRPDMNGNDPRGRAANLRANIFTKATSNVASSRNNSDWSGTDPYGGICLSCHTVAQTKNQTRQFNDGSTKTLRLFTSMYRNTPHNYTAIGVIGKDSSRFKANCLKCHNDTMQKTKFVSATTTGFGLHDSKLRRLNAKLGLSIYDGTVASSSNSTLVVSGTPWVADEWKTRVVTITSGTGVGQTRVVLSNTIDTLNLTKVWSTNPGAGATFTIGDPPEEDFCFNCHSQTSNPYGSDAAGNKDYYGMVTFVNKKALKMEQTFTGDNGSITTGGSATTFTDSSKSWTPGQWVGYSVKFLSGTSKNVGKERVISTNSATSVTWVTALSANTAAGDTYSIGNPFRHRIDQFSGQHQSDEAIAAPGTTTAAGWFGDTGTGVHVGCADCHNPHAQRKPGSDRGTSTNDAFTTQSTIKIAGKNWASNQWIGYVAVAVDRSQAGDERMIVSNTADRFKVGATFSPRMTGVYFTIIPRGRANIATDIQGNYLNGPNNGGWGVKAPLTSWPSPAPDTAGDSNNVQSPAFSKVTTLVAMKNKVYDLCLKCHSDYGWGTSGTPFRIMDGGISAMGVYTAGASRNIGKLINPNNLAHHALVAPGNNQPIRPNYGLTNISSYYNNNWPSWKGSATRRLRMTTGGHANVNQAMPSTVIPGWYLYVGSTVPNAKTNGTAGIGATTPYYKGWLQIKSMVNYTSFDVDTTGISIPASFTNRSGFSISAGLGNAFVPPYGPWSVINCADCHDTDGSGDPSGPHGSGRNWLLRKMEAQKFPWFNGTNVIPVGWDVDGWATAAKWAPNTLCLNCHRADVYGNEGHDPLATTTSGGTGTAPTTTSGKWFNWAWRGHYSRQPHSPDLGDVYASKNGGTTTTFRVICMQCHGGDGTGSIHGTNLGASHDAVGVPLASASYRGKRFLTGGAWTGLTRGTTTVAGSCWYDPKTTMIPVTINNCGGSGPNIEGFRTFATYNYDGGPDY